MDFKSKYNILVNVVNEALYKYICEKDCPQKTIYRAMRYSLEAGGKRLRPVLALSVCDLLGGDSKEVLPYACAIELIHTYSLIHDDLPAMDNDDYRRGKLTNHKVFGEATAILAGDALLNYAFEIMLCDVGRDAPPLNIVKKIKAMDIIAKASGVSGMIGGQIIDLEAEGKVIKEDLLKLMHRCKTGALIKAPVLAAAAICDANDEKTKLLERFAEGIGLAFQIKDDILDVEGNSEIMGKPKGSDFANKKSTFVTLYGLEQSKKMLADITKLSLNNIEEFGAKAQFLRDLAEFLTSRDK